MLERIGFFFTHNTVIACLLSLCVVIVIVSMVKNRAKLIGLFHTPHSTLIFVIILAGVSLVCIGALYAVLIAS